MRRRWHPLPHSTGGMALFIVIVIHKCFRLFLLLRALRSPTSRNFLL